MKRYYTVSFGDSNIYSTTSFTDADSLREAIIEELERKFPQGNVRSIVTLDIREVDADEAAKYPQLDDATIEKISDTLKREMQVEASDREMNNDAPYSNI